MNKILTLALLIVALAPLAGCGNTAEGFGRDLERAGQSIQKRV